MMPKTFVDWAFDSKVTEPLAKRLPDVLNNRALGFMVSMDHRTGCWMGRANYRSSFLAPDGLLH